MKKKITFYMTSLMLMVVNFSLAQLTITGTVSDDEGIPLPGATVLVQNTSNGVSTDFDGLYTITANTGDVLVFSFVGYANQSVTVGASDQIDVVLTSEGALEEVIVTAFGTSTKESFTGSADVVTAKDLELRVATSPIAALEGATSGVQFIAATGQPGSSPDIVIRGVGTLNGSNTPLYVLDGVQFQGDLASLNQEDIESLTVLKDAASTALYGARAANGVVMITTKQGKRNSPMKVNFSVQSGVSNDALGQYDAANPQQYYEIMWEAYKNTLNGTPSENAIEASNSIFNRLGYNPFNVANDQIVDTSGNINPNAQVIYQGLDWFDALQRTGVRNNYNLNISNGTEKSQIFFSASYLDETGYTIETDFERITTRLNTTLTPKSWLSLGANLSLTLAESAGAQSGGTSSIVNPFAFAKNIGSIYPVTLVDDTGSQILDAAGNVIYDDGEGNSAFGIQARPYSLGRNAVAEAYYNNLLDRNNNIGARFFGEFTFMPGLTLKLTYGQDIQDSVSSRYENAEIGDGAPTARYRETRFRRVVENFSQVINYRKSLNDIHNFALTIGHESFDRNFSNMSGFKNTQTATGIYEFDNFSVISSLDGYSSDKRSEGYFGRLNYDFNEKYFVSASARRDGSSVFNKDVRWGNFYSVGASWLIHKESFMDSVPFVDNLKLRASYGEVGNDSLGNFYISQPLYSLYSNAGAPALYWDKLGNNALTWETIESFDLALEFTLFNRFIDGTLEYYKKTSSDLLYNLPIAPSNGLKEKPDNVGTLYNSGLELELTAHLFDSQDFSWDLSLQASTFKNEITELPTPFTSGSKRWDVGRSVFDYYIYDWAGVDPANGNSLYYMYEDNAAGDQRVPVLASDGSHETTNDYQAAGRAYTGDSSIPDFIGSIQNNLSYKNFSLNVLFTFSQGGEILDGGYSAMMHPGTYGRSIHVDALNSWKAPGDITSIPRLESGDPNQSVSSSSRYLTDASFVSLRNLNISYDLTDAIGKQLAVDNLRIFVSGENLYINSARDGLNPQYNLGGTPAGNNYNPARTISAGLNLTF
jgi:TonB-linked SusC/RagA family outer membrane protein